MVRNVVLVVLVAAVIAGLAAWTVGTPPPPEDFTTGTAAVLVGYLFYPVLMLVGPTLLVVSLLFALGSLIERRRPHGQR